MKMNYYFPFALLLLMSLSENVVAEGSLAVESIQNEASQLTISEADMGLIQEQFGKMMERIYDILMPSYKKLYKEYFDDIEWVEHYYVTDMVKGDKILNKFSQELMKIMPDMLDPVIDEALQATNVKLADQVISQIKENFKTSMLQIMPTIITQSLKKNAELKSSVYQEILNEKSKAKPIQKK